MCCSRRARLPSGRPDYRRGVDAQDRYAATIGEYAEHLALERGRSEHNRRVYLAELRSLFASSTSAPRSPMMGVTTKQIGYGVPLRYSVGEGPTGGTTLGTGQGRLPDSAQLFPAANSFLGRKRSHLLLIEYVHETTGTRQAQQVPAMP